MRFGHKSLVG